MPLAVVLGEEGGKGREGGNACRQRMRGPRSPSSPSRPGIPKISCRSDWSSERSACPGVFVVVGVCRRQSTAADRFGWWKLREEGVRNVPQSGRNRTTLLTH
ncbi:hypothetical protein ISCGN_004311 [Ixodes scapularis]